MKRLLALVGVFASLVGAVAVGAYLPLGRTDDTASASATPPVPVATATVTRRTMRSTEEFDGTLGYAGEGVIISGLDGTYTKPPAVGDILTLGDQICEVDGTHDSYLMYGTRPAWRPLDNDSTNGPDVKQLEQSLQELGYFDHKAEPDWNFGLKTENAVERWERKTNQEQDGAIGPGQVVFLPHDVRITEVVPELGSSARAGTVLARTSGTRLVVTLDLEADRRDILAVGDGVTIEMPDASVSAGTVTEIDSVAQTQPGANEPTVGVNIELAENATTGELDGAGVTVSVVRQTRPDVLSVPVDALLALREGGYAIEIMEADGSTHLTGVEVGLFDDSDVEISGGVEVEVTRPSDALEARAAAAVAFTELFLGLGAVALIVGGVGIANVMLMSVLERRPEIGLRRALVATRRHIAMQFVSEALALALVGGVLGVLPGGGHAVAYALSQEWMPIIPAVAVVGGVLAALAIGALAGFYPAMRAARLSPTDALRGSE